MSQNQTPANNKKRIIIILSAFISVIMVFSAIQFFAPENLKPIKNGKTEEAVQNENIKKEENNVKVMEQNTTVLENQKKVQPMIDQVDKPSEQQVQTSTTNLKQKTYTNPSFPDFKLVYDDSWSFEINESESNYPGLKSWYLQLKKGEAVIMTTIFPKSETLKETLNGYSTSSAKVGELKNGIVKYSYEPDKSVRSIIYGSQSSVLNFMKTNLVAKNFPTYFSSTNGEDEFVTYIIQPNIDYFTKCPAEIEPPCQPEKVDPNLEIEADKIIENSVFK